MTKEYEVTVPQLYQWWWLHDGRWYQEVAQRFGFDAANEINRNAIRFVASRVAKSVAKSFTVPIDQMEWPDVVAAFEKCSRLMWPPEMIDMKCEVTSRGAFEVHITRNFALQMLQRAGTLATYQCACLALREGWFEGLGLKPVENSMQRCLKDGAPSCSFTGRIERPATEER